MRNDFFRRPDRLATKQSSGSGGGCGDKDAISHRFRELRNRSSLMQDFFAMRRELPSLGIKGINLGIDQDEIARAHVPHDSGRRAHIGRNPRSNQDHSAVFQHGNEKQRSLALKKQ
jgi:hypothetical protein